MGALTHGWPALYGRPQSVRQGCPSTVLYLRNRTVPYSEVRYTRGFASSIPYYIYIVVRLFAACVPCILYTTYTVYRVPVQGVPPVLRTYIYNPPGYNRGHTRRYGLGQVIYKDHGRVHTAFQTSDTVTRPLTRPSHSQRYFGQSSSGQPTPPYVVAPAPHSVRFGIF